MIALIKSSDHALTDASKRLIHSYSSDLISAVSGGKVVTLKHFLIGVGLHNITGLKAPIKILSHLGHSIDYNLVCEIETSRAEEAIKNLEEHDHLYDDTAECILTYWWADNFNQNIETQTGHGAIDSTHIVEFSEGVVQSNSMVSLIDGNFISLHEIWCCLSRYYQDLCILSW